MNLAIKDKRRNKNSNFWGIIKKIFRKILNIYLVIVYKLFFSY